jgi:alanyl-tRNA synthetase
MAMAGGTDPSKLNAALEGVKDWVASKWVIKILYLMQK